MKQEKKIVSENKNDTKKKKKKIKIDMRKTMIVGSIILLTALVYAGYLVIKLFLNPTDTFMIENGTLYQEESLTGYIIRDEMVVKGENYKNGMIQIKSEGERVAKEDPIFRYYSTGEDNLKKKIQELDVQIQTAMSEKNDLFSSDIKLLESQIETKLNAVYELNDIQKVKEYKRDINSYITKKAKIAGDLSPAGSYLKKLIDERSSYENQLNSGSEYLNAPVSGIVSYRVDGLEEVLTPNGFSSLNKKMLDDLNLKTGQIIATSEESAKIINNYSCYIAFVTKQTEADNVKVGGTLKLRLPSSEEIKSTIQYIVDEGNDGKLIVVEIETSVQELINYRKISFDVIWWNASGYKVPNSAIKEENNLSYVVRNRNGYTDQIAVEILKQNDKYSIVGNYNTQELKDLGISSKSLTLYDEILLNPNKKK